MSKVTMQTASHYMYKVHSPIHGTVLVDQPGDRKVIETVCYITTDQAEAYKDACVREALMEAAEIADSMNAFAVYDAIRAMIPREAT